MRIKSFFAKSVDEAMAQARAQLGADAMLLNTRKVSSPDGQPAGYEVVFGTVSDELPAPQALSDRPQTFSDRPQALPDKPQLLPAKPQAFSEYALTLSDKPQAFSDKPQAFSDKPQAFSDKPQGLPDKPPVFAPKMIAEPEPRIEAPQPPLRLDPFAGELQRLQGQMDEIRGLILRSSRSHLPIGRTVPELAEVYSRLLAAEVDPVLARDIVDRLEASIATDAFFERSVPGRPQTANRWKALQCDSGRLEKFVRAEMERRVGVDSHLGSVVVLVGPTGAGKTTSLVKLATSLSEGPLGQPVRLLTVDTSRPSGYLQLQSLAQPFGIDCEPVQSIDRLPELLARPKSNQRLMVDTPGYPGHDGKVAEATAKLLSQCPGIDVHLVVPGYIRANDLRRCIQRYEMFRPSKLLVTKLDETEALGPVFSEAARAGLRLSFLTHGPAIPEDIRAASVEDFIAMVLDRPKALAQNVA